MKKWQEILLCVVMLVFADTFFDFIKTLSENGTLSKWFFVLVSLIVFVVGWTAVFLSVKSSKNRQHKQWKPVFTYVFVVYSFFMTFDVMKYSLENNMLNTYYFYAIGLALIFVGWATEHLYRILPTQQKKQN